MLLPMLLAIKIVLICMLLFVILNLAMALVRMLRGETQISAPLGRRLYLSAAIILLLLLLLASGGWQLNPRPF